MKKGTTKQANRQQGDVLCRATRTAGTCPAGDGSPRASHASWVAVEESVAGVSLSPTGTVSMSPVMLLRWQEPSGASIAAGKGVSGFSVTSPYLPGLTIAYARSDVDYAVPPGLPAAVNAQLQVMRERDWMNRAVPAIGPRFPRAWTRDVIAADFKAGIYKLVASGDLDPTSAFVVSLRPALDNIISSGGGSVLLGPVVSAATTTLETSIANAISISLQ